MPVKNGPDFLCVGMHKAGTQWLYDQLAAHPDFWMPPIKELHYLERGRRAGENAAEIRIGERASARGGGWRRLSDPRDRAFIKEMASHAGKPLDLARYASLFRHKGELLSGDITPQYGALEESAVSEITAALPDTMIILLVRDPVARAWSHICQWYRREQFDPKLLDNPDAFRNFLERSRRIEKFSRASRVAERWRPRVRAGQFRYFFLEEISKDPSAVRHEILTALGADPAKTGRDVDPGYNRKAGGKKLEMTRAAEIVLAEFFSDELRACAALFGGCAKEWVRKYENVPAAAGN